MYNLSADKVLPGVVWDKISKQILKQLLVQCQAGYSLSIQRETDVLRYDIYVYGVLCASTRT